jgi:hypothetical protein
LLAARRPFDRRGAVEPERHAVERIRVQFEGGGLGAGEPSWGQREVYGVGGHEGRHVTMGGVSALPPGISAQAVADGLGHLIGRHPALRTRYLVGPANRLSRQAVHERGEVWLDVVDVDGPDPGRTARDLAAEFDASRFDCVRDWPVRIAVVRERGELTHTVAVYNHLAIDAYGLDALLADLLTRDPQTGLWPPPPEAASALDQAAWQSSAAGLRQNDRALRYWNRLLRQIPPLGLAGERAAVEPDRGCYGKIVFDSPAADLAVRLIAQRTRQDSGHVLLAAYAVAVARVTGLNPVALRAVVGNRFRPGLADSISAVSQTGLFALDTADAGFDEVVTRAWRAALDMYKNSYYDPLGRQELFDTISAERGRTLTVDCCYNDRRRGRPGPAGDAAADGPGRPDRAEPPDPADLPGAVDRGRLSWEEWTSPTTPVGETLYVHVDDGPGSVVFTVCGDTGFLSAAGLEECARMIEAVLVEAAADPAVPTGVRPGVGTVLRPVTR